MNLEACDSPAFHAQSNCSVHGVVVYQSNHTHDGRFNGVAPKKSKRMKIFASEKYVFLHSFATLSGKKNKTFAKIIDDVKTMLIFPAINIFVSRD